MKPIARTIAPKAIVAATWPNAQFVQVVWFVPIFLMAKLAFPDFKHAVGFLPNIRIELLQSTYQHLLRECPGLVGIR